MSAEIGVNGTQELETVDEREHSDDASFASGDADKPVVLIVDDDATARLTLSAQLAKEYCRIVLANNADEARERLPDIQPDVILCDLVMQGTNGDQFCHWLKLHGAWRYVPVIAITRIDNIVATAALLDAGADDVIVKPVRTRELQARVAAALRTRDRYLDLAQRAYERRSYERRSCDRGVAGTLGE